MKVFILGLMFLPVSVWAAVQSLSPSGGEVDILSIGKPGFIKIRGVGSPPTGKLNIDGESVSGNLEFDLSTLDTGISTRNEHMKNKYLETGKFPKAQLELKNLQLSKGWSLSSPKLAGTEFTGTLTLHGVSKPVKGTFSMTDDRKVEAQFNVKLSDYSVNVPSFAGVTVADDVEVKVKINKIDSI